MSVVDAIIKANQEGRKVEWPAGEGNIEALKDCIGNLLKIIDDMSSESLHLKGLTPDWYVYAAYLSTFGKKPKGFDEFPKTEKCIRCETIEQSDHLSVYGFCESCHDDMLG